MQEKVIQALMDYLDVERDLITLNSRFDQDFGMDSLDFVEMIVMIEKDMNVGIDKKDFKDIETVYDLIEYIEEVNV